MQQQTKLESLSEIFEHKLAQNIKSDSKSFYAYVRSKQNAATNEVRKSKRNF